MVRIAYNKAKSFLKIKLIIQKLSTKVSSQVFIWFPNRVGPKVNTTDPWTSYHGGFGQTPSTQSKILV